ncbi:hypothetical protein [Yoonia sp. SS1-5]|uniref:Uncharacterized protein n=1 Tax=Yoonia rhodophyticola TaxID=3137370 RepID=A0AAN0M808_9RHOB
MTHIRIGFLAILLTLANASLADQRIRAFVHSDEVARFAIHSAELFSSSGGYQTEYSICNIDDRNPLIYKWPDTGMESKSYRPLPLGGCHILQIPSEMRPKPRGTVTYYTQASRPYNWDAILRSDNGQNQVQPFRRYLNSLKAFFGNSDEPDSQAVGYVWLEVSQTTDATGLETSIGWNDNNISIVVPQGALDGVGGQELIDAINQQGYLARQGTLGDIVEDDEISESEEASNQAIELSNPDNASSPVTLSLPEYSEFFESIFYLIDRETRRIVASGKFYLVR